MSTLVTLAGFSRPEEYGVMKAKLESEGIPCYIRTDTTQWISGRRLGTIVLQVRKGDVHRACAVLRMDVPAPVRDTPLTGLGEWLHRLMLRVVPLDRRRRDQ